MSVIVVYSVLFTVLAVVHSLGVIPLPSSYASSSPRRSRRTVLTLRCFLLIAGVSIVIAVSSVSSPAFLLQKKIMVIRCPFPSCCACCTHCFNGDLSPVTCGDQPCPSLSLCGFFSPPPFVPLSYGRRMITTSNIVLSSLSSLCPTTASQQLHRQKLSIYLG